jgi:DNA-binding MurR/RpiR family transcriptional regulator
MSDAHHPDEPDAIDMEAAGAMPAPQEFRALRDLIIARRDALPRRLAQVAAYAIESPDEMAFGTVASIATAAEVQPSTLVRFAKALGYGGFSDLQAVFQERLRDRPTNYDERLDAFHTHVSGRPVTSAMLDGFGKAAQRSVERVCERLDPLLMERATNILADAETIYLIAQRRSFPITAYMAYAFGKLGIRTVLAGSAVGIDRETLNFAGPRDAAFAVSFTPYASETVNLTRQVAAQGVPVVVVTDSPFSPLVPSNGVWLEVVEADFEGFRSLAATMTVAMTLTVAVAERRRKS